MAGRGVGCHQHLAADGHPRVHDLLLPFRRKRHRLRRAFMRHHHLDLPAQHLLVELEGCFAIAVVKKIGIELHRLLLGGLRLGMSGYLSASIFRLARPTSKSLPTMLSIFMNTCISFDRKGAGPCMSQLRFVASPCGRSVNSAVLWPSNGVKKSSLMTIFDGAEVSRISIR